MSEITEIWHDIQRIREDAPLVHNITNYVVMNTTANALLAIGASPVMAHAPEEVEEMTALSRALVINIGTLSAPWVEAMVKAGRQARKLGIPVVLDPGGSGATKFRTSVARRLMEEVQPAIVRGNASEIGSLLTHDARTKGVDSLHTPDEIIDAARHLSRTAGCVVSVSGPEDLVVEGDRTIRVSNGHVMMTRVTGLGCTASAVTGAFAAVNPSRLEAAAHAMVLMGVAGEIAVERSPGPGSLQVNFLDTLSLMDRSDLAARAKMRRE